MNIAVNAAIAKEAAAARLAMAAQALAECRQENNPYLASPLGLGRQAMWGPDPCQSQFEEVEAAREAAQIASAPTQQNLAVAPGLELSETWDVAALIDPTTMNVDIPGDMNNLWSPQGILDVMDMIAAEMEVGSEEEEEMELVYRNMVAVQMWDPSYPTFKRKRYRLRPKEQKWIGIWAPNQ